MLAAGPEPEPEPELGPEPGVEAEESLSLGGRVGLGHRRPWELISSASMEGPWCR